MNNIRQFPEGDKQPKHIYKYETCAGCGRQLTDDEPITEIILTNNDGMTRTHIALCENCESLAEGHGTFKD